MSQYFSKDYFGGSFVLLGPAHGAVLGLTAGIMLVLGLRGRTLSRQAGRNLRSGLVALLVANEMGWHLWTFGTGQWSVRTMLPLHLCSVTSWLSILCLIRRCPPAYDFVYFLGIAGAAHTLLTPDLGPYGFPHLRFFLTIVSHAGILVAAMFLTFVDGLRPTWESVRRVIVWANVYGVFVFFLNLAIGSNYMYLARKPSTPSLVDMLGPWPWYILALEMLGLLHVLGLYAPFAIADARALRANPGSQSQGGLPGSPVGR
jgi:hypothetical integral membrane protein (TIGR02206 family)